jgi:archaemetzincin
VEVGSWHLYFCLLPFDFCLLTWFFVPIDILPLADLNPSHLAPLPARLAQAFRSDCRLRPDTLDASFALDSRRDQYHSTAILQAMQPLANGSRILAVTSLDLFVPVLTFVFGEAQLEGNCAVVSIHRLREEVYGLPPNPRLLAERLAKEAVHELGHTFGLRHCNDWSCAMASSHSVEWLDVKGADLCAACRKAIAAVR